MAKRQDQSSEPAKPGSTSGNPEAGEERLRGTGGDDPSGDLDDEFEDEDELDDEEEENEGGI